jgi:hypothetical protein
MFKKLIMPLVAVLLMSGCGSGFVVGQTKTVGPTIPAKSFTAPDFAIYPAAYTVTGFIQGATLEMKFTVYNDLDFPSPADVTIALPSYSSLQGNKGFQSWEQAPIYAQVIGGGVDIPAKGSLDVTVRVYVPEAEANMPDKWMFFVEYQSEGHYWGTYWMTAGNNFVFYPGVFSPVITDKAQIFTWITWGNNPLVMVRRGYDSPPQTISDGVLVYEGAGVQIIQPWQDPASGDILQRQYTKYLISDSQELQPGGNEKVFYRAWQQHLERGVWDGTWDAISQTIFIPDVQAKVLVSK